MRALLFCLVGLMTASSDLALAQMKLLTKPANANETRYFTAIDGLMDGNADVILKETRQGKECDLGGARRLLSGREGFGPQGPLRRRSRGQRPDHDRHHPDPRRQTAGHGQTGAQADRRHVRIQGQIGIGPTVTEVASSDNSDLSEKEFKDNQTVDDGITPAPKDFSEVSPESIGVR